MDEGGWVSDAFSLSPDPSFEGILSDAVFPFVSELLFGLDGWLSTVPLSTFPFVDPTLPPFGDVCGDDVFPFVPED